MTQRPIIYTFCYGFLIIVFGSCAKPNTPSGGPRDRVPPVVVKSLPESKTANFKGNRVEVTFDEFVVLDNINEKFMVSPPMKKKPRVYIKGKSLITEFAEDLKDSTTYTLNFQDAVRDLNEGNIFENFQFVLSTGPVLDSLSVTGNVYNAFDLNVAEKALVLLYKDLADSAVKKHLPDYITRVDKEGYFRIDNVKAGKYRLYALADADNSRNYNQEDEEFAFMPAPIEVTAANSFISPPTADTGKINLSKIKAVPAPEKKSEYKLYLFKGQRKNYYLTSSSRAPKYELLYTLSLPPAKFGFDFSIIDASPDKYFIERNRTNDTMKVWITDSTLYSQPQINSVIKYPFTDSLGAVVITTDTIPMRYVAPRAPRVAKVKKASLIVSLNLGNGTLKPGQQIIFNSSTPFSKPDTSAIRLYELNETVKKKMTYSMIPDNTNSCRYFLKSNLTPGKRYQYITDAGAFSDIYGLASDSTGTTFSVGLPDSYCKLTLIISNFEGDRIIQLLGSSEKLLGEVLLKGPGKVDFPLLDPGVYSIRAIIDLNGDGKWTTGDFITGRLPEPVTYYPAEIELRTGFNIEQTWVLGTEYFKDAKLRIKKK